MAPKDDPLDKALPISPPSRKARGDERPGAPDLRIEEIEERHVPRDRNIFDK